MELGGGSTSVMDGTSGDVAQALKLASETRSLILSNSLPRIPTFFPLTVISLSTSTIIIFFFLVSSIHSLVGSQLSHVQTHLLYPPLSYFVVSPPSAPLLRPPDFGLAVALFHQTHAVPYKPVAHRFGLVSSEMACCVFFSVCKAVIEKLENLVELRNDMGKIVVGFGWISLSNCCGVSGFGRFGFDCDVLGRNGSLLV